jgi:phosphatidylglycerophosphatase A
MGAATRSNSREGAVIIKDRLVIIIATGGFVGFLPLAPGTWGALAGCLLWFPLSRLSPILQAIAILALIGLGVWTSGLAEVALGGKDPSVIIIDEIVGMLLTYFMLPVALTSLLFGFAFFRFFDILKPVPILERIAGGWGIMLDDLCAGIVAHFCTRLALSLL